MTKYTKFFAMIFTSTALMLLMMYFNTFELGHVFFSETRLYMAIYMGAMMAIVMLLFMLHMYENKTKNGLILIGSVAVFTISLFLVRSQLTVADTSWMKAMIPHHSIAILTSSRANIQDKRVQTLANEIVRAQEREIKEMKWLLEDIEQNGLAKSEQDAANRAVPDFSQQ
jgi:magnesium-transporting ATPase (P-type)